jgi:hypothetical protein
MSFGVLWTAKEWKTGCKAGPNTEVEDQKRKGAKNKGVDHAPKRYS